MRALLLLALAGCNELYDLRATELAPPDDQDRDGEADGTDNCIDVANDQQDLDEDGIGDVCDNCPLVANSAQEHVGDADALGDVCDPHPIDDGDCLLVLDSFRDPAAFAQHWRTLTNDPAPDIRIDPGSVAIVPASSPIAIATDMALVRLDVTVLATLPTLTAGHLIAAFTNETATTAGDRCVLQRDAADKVTIAPSPSGLGASFRPALSSVPLRDRLLLRHATRILPNGDFEMRCRADYGIGVAAVQGRTPASIDNGGMSGVMTSRDAITLHAVALSRFQPGEACAPTIIR